MKRPDILSMSWTEANTPLVRVGDYRRQLAFLGPEVCDSIICDPPFGVRTHEGARTCAAHDTHGVNYDQWSAVDVRSFVPWATFRARRWIFAMTSHDLIAHWEASYRAAGWYPFAPVSIVIRGMGVRRQGDGPASWTLYGMAARARSRQAMCNPYSNGTALWRALPGAYVTTPGPGRRAGNGLGKPAELLDAIVRDYSNPGDLVVDPFAGHGSTIQAALKLRRRALGSEIRPFVAKIANKAIAETMAEMRQRNSAA